MSKKSVVLKSTWVERNILFGLTAREAFYTHFEQEMQAGNELQSAQKNYVSILVKTKKNRLKRVFDRIFHVSLRGKTFGDRFGDLLPFDERIILNAASQAGNELETFKLLKERVAHKKKSGWIPLLALLYPLLTIAIGLDAWKRYGENLARMQNSMMEGGEFTGKLAFFVRFYEYADWLLPTVVTLFIIVCFVFAKSLPSWTGGRRTQADKYFPFSLYRQFQTTNFLITYASLRKRGMQEKAALKAISDYSIPWLQVRLNRIMKLMRGHGQSFGNASISAGFNVPEHAHALIMHSMNQNKDFGDRLMDFAQEAQANVMGKLKATFAALFFILLVAGLGAQYAITLVSGEIKSQVTEARNRF